MGEYMKYINIKQRTPEWLEWRKTGVTATDSVVLYYPDKTKKTEWRLWAEKKGKAKEVDLTLNPLVQAGIRNEKYACKAFERKHNVLLFSACVVSEECPYMYASLDGLNEHGEPVELKCPHETTWTDVKVNGIKSKAFVLYYPQVQHQIYVTDAKRGWLAFFLNGEIISFCIDRDDKMIREIIKNAEYFIKHLSGSSEPARDPNKDLFIPEGNNIREWLIASKNYIDAFNEINSYKTKIESLKETLATNKSRMVDMMGNYLHADYGGVLVSRYTTDGTIDYFKLINDLNPDLLLKADQYRKESRQQVRVTPIDEMISRDLIVKSLEEGVNTWRSPENVVESFY